MEKIDIEEILLQNHFHILNTLKTVYSPDTHNENMYERLINGIKDICKQTIELAAENAYCDHEFDGAHGCEYGVNKPSILDTINQVE